MGLGIDLGVRHVLGGAVAGLADAVPVAGNSQGSTVAQFAPSASIRCLMLALGLC